MKKYFFLYILFIFSYSYSYLCAQQNFINVPSSEVTEKHKIFFQQQLNFNELVQSNSTLDFGLGNGFEIGANVLGLNFSDKNRSFIKNDTNDKDPYNPLVMLNGLKHFGISENISFSVGSQCGLNFRDNKRTTSAALVYGNFLIKNMVVKNSNLVLGTYYNSLHYGGRFGNRFGAWVGAEVPVKPYFHIMAESVFGTNALCYTSVGIILYPVRWMPLTLGMQIPNTKNNAYSIVFELTIIPISKKI